MYFNRIKHTVLSLVSVAHYTINWTRTKPESYLPLYVPSFGSTTPDTKEVSPKDYQIQGDSTLEDDEVVKNQVNLW